MTDHADVEHGERAVSVDIESLIEALSEAESNWHIDGLDICRHAARELARLQGESPLRRDGVLSGMLRAFEERCSEPGCRERSAQTHDGYPYCGAHSVKGES